MTVGSWIACAACKQYFCGYISFNNQLQCSQVNNLKLSVFHSAGTRNASPTLDCKQHVQKPSVCQEIQTQDSGEPLTSHRTNSTYTQTPYWSSKFFTKVKQPYTIYQTRNRHNKTVSHSASTWP